MTAGTRARLGRCPWLIAALLAGHAAAAEPGGVRFVDPEGRPVAGAAIELFTLPENAGPLAAARTLLWRATSREDGMAELRLPFGKRLLLMADAPGFVPLAQEISHPSDRIALSRGRGLQGHVQVAGGPVAGARVCASWKTDLVEWRRSREWRRCASTAAAGEFRIAGLPASEVEVTAAADGLLPAKLSAVPGTPLTIPLETGVTLAGRVVGPLADPVRGAAVEVEGAGTATTDAKGVFRVAARRLPATLSATAGGYAPATQRVDAAAAKDAKEVLVRLRPAERITGTMVGEQSLPIERAVVYLERRAGADWRTDRREVTTERGDFELDLGTPGSYRLTVRAEGYRPLRVPELEVHAGEARKLGVLALSRGGGVRGRAVDGAAGEPVAGAQVDLMPLGGGALFASLRGVRLSSVSDVAGAFEIAGADVGRYELRVDRPGFAQEIQPVDLTREGLEDLGEIALSQGVEVRGRVLDRRGAPRRGARLEIRDPESSGYEPLHERVTDGEGRFPELLLAPGTYQVRVAGERLLLVQSIEIEAGAASRDLELRAGGVAVSGMVRRGEEPAPGGSLSFASDLDPGLRRGKIVLNTGGSLAPSKAVFGAPATLFAEVGEDGGFALADVPPGAVWATYCGPVGECVTRQVEVPDTDQTWLDLDVAGLSLTGRAFDAASEAGVPATVRVVSSSGEVVATTLATDEGGFTVADLAPGAYALEASAPEYEVAVLKAFTLERDGQSVALAMRRGETGSLVIELTYEGGAPVAFSPVTLLHQSGRMIRGLPTDGHGQQRFDDLPTGSYVVVWSDALAGTGASEPLRVAAGQSVVWRKTLEPGVPLSLQCGEASCSDRPVELLALFPAAGVDVSPYLSGLEVGLRFSPDGGLPLGRVSPGTYMLRIAAGGREFQKALSVAPGSGLFTLP